MARKPLDQDLYDSVVAEAKRKFAVWPSAYASGWVVKTYKERGGRYAGVGRKERTGLTKWFGEHWVDLSRPIREGGEVVGYEPCGRKRSDDPAEYPKCRPAREALRMSKEEVADAVRRKRRAEASAPARGSRARSPTRVATYRQNPRKPPPLTERELEDLPRANAFWMDFEIENGPEYLPAAMQDAQWPADRDDVELARAVLAFCYRNAPGNY